MVSDPLSSALNSDTSATSSVTNAPHIPNMFNMQSMMQMQIMNNVMSNLSFLETGHPMIDMILRTMIQSLIISVIAIAIAQIGNIIDAMKKINNRGFGYAWILFLNFIYFVKTKILRMKVRKIIHRNVDIPYITDNRQINELYRAVFWFLSNNTEINYLHEPYLQYVFDKKISMETREMVRKNLAIHKVLAQQKVKEIMFKNHKIKYSLSTELITMYTDKDRKRENFKVSLYAEVDECEQTDIMEQFCQNCLTEYINNLTSNTWEQLIYTNDGSEWKSAPSHNTRKLDTIILKKGLKESLKNDVQLFLNSEEWYLERDIPYTRGYIFYGFPGTGKTSMIKGLSLFCKRHIHTLNLSVVKTDTELVELFKKINYKDTILVIEDIDAMNEIVKSRDNRDNKNARHTDSPTSNKSDPRDYESEEDRRRRIDRDRRDEEEKSHLTLSGLLNALDGVFQHHGRILIMTTNHPEVLDPALIRPGRIDSKYLFDNCDKDQIKGLFEMFFNQPCINPQIDMIKNDSYSPAHITSVFLRYRNNPQDALLHLDDIETKIQLTQLIKSDP
jgi:RNA polymerase-binding transcription factor DksA